MQSHKLARANSPRFFKPFGKFDSCVRFIRGLIVHGFREIPNKKTKSNFGIVIIPILIVFSLFLIVGTFLFFNFKRSESSNDFKINPKREGKTFGDLLKSSPSSNTPTPTISATPTPKPPPARTSTPKPTLTPKPTNASNSKKVMLIIFNPILEGRGGKKLTQEENWNDHVSLSQSYISDLKNISGGFVNYQIVSTQEVDGIPEKEDGYKYSDDTYLTCWENRSSCHNPDTANYLKILSDYGVCEKRNSGEIDEVWLFGGPYFGFYESRLTGPEAFFYNSPPLEGSSCQKQLPIMGFNYERGVSEMIEDMGHRTESVLDKVFGSRSPDGNNSWGRFALRDIDSPGQAGCGNVHFGPNGTSDYDWLNQRTVSSSCEDWSNYPNLTGKVESINCQAWGCDGYGFKKWWLSHLPRANSKTNGKLDNWWKYVLDYENANRE